MNKAIMSVTTMIVSKKIRERERERVLVKYIEMSKDFSEFDTPMMNALRVMMMSFRKRKWM